MEDVRKAYGKPSDEDKVEGTKYRVLVYRGGAADDFKASMFGIRNRKVAWIVLSKHE